MKQPISFAFLVVIPFLSIHVIAEAESTSLHYDFKDASVVEEWRGTDSVSMEPGSNGLDLLATGYDAKIYKKIQLQPGKYVLYARSSGRIKLGVLPSWGQENICHLSMSSEAPLTDYVDFEVRGEKKTPLLLYAWLAERKHRGTLEWIRIETAPISQTESDPIPSPEELAKHRPNPPIVRGFMVGSNWSRQTFQDMAKWGANVARIQFNPTAPIKNQALTVWDVWPQMLDEIEQAVKNAESVGMKVVIDLHGPPIKEVIEKKQSDQPGLWLHPDLESNFVRIWTDVAKRLKPYSKTIWAYDLYNEPLDREQLPWAPKQWRPLAVKLVKAIRQIDPDVWIIYECGPGGMDRGFNGLLPLPDTKVIYSMHYYSPGEFTHQGINNVAGMDRTDVGQYKGVSYPGTIKGLNFNKESHLKKMQATIAFQKKWNVPIFIGEFSVIRWAPKEDAARWLQDTVDTFETLGWSWCYHAFREFQGWSLEHDETPWKKGDPEPKPAEQITERGKVIMKAFDKNQR